MWAQVKREKVERGGTLIAYFVQVNGEQSSLWLSAQPVFWNSAGMPFGLLQWNTHIHGSKFKDASLIRNTEFWTIWAHLCLFFLLNPDLLC